MVRKLAFGLMAFGMLASSTAFAESGEVYNPQQSPLRQAKRFAYLWPLCSKLGYTTTTTPEAALEKAVRLSMSRGATRKAALFYADDWAKAYAFSFSSHIDPIRNRIRSAVMLDQTDKAGDALADAMFLVKDRCEEVADSEIMTGMVKRPAEDQRVAYEKEFMGAFYDGLNMQRLLALKQK